MAEAWQPLPAEHRKNPNAEMAIQTADTSQKDRTRTIWQHSQFKPCTKNTVTWKPNAGPGKNDREECNRNNRNVPKTQEHGTQEKHIGDNIFIP